MHTKRRMETMSGANETEERSETIRIRRGQFESLKKLNRTLYDAGERQPSERREGTAIAIRELILTCLRLQNPTARVILQAQLDEMEGTIESQRALLRQQGDLAVTRETAASESRRRVAATEARNRELRSALYSVCGWLALAIAKDPDDTDGVDAAARSIMKAAEARTMAAAEASAERREFTAEDEHGFVRGILPRGSGKRIARMARPFPPEGGL